MKSAGFYPQHCLVIEYYNSQVSSLYFHIKLDRCHSVSLISRYLFGLWEEKVVLVIEIERESESLT